MATRRLEALIGPSVINADMSWLADECNRLKDAGADYLHLDIMDGHFVPNLTFGHPVVKCIRKHVPEAFFDMHMMVARPETWVAPMADAGASQYTFHLEATNDPVGLMRRIRETGMKAGVAIKPGTPVEDLMPYLEGEEGADMALIMTVEPGFGGQAFMADMMSKVRMIRQAHPLLNIEVDGGVKESNVGLCGEAGANMIVSGTGVVLSPDPAETIKSMREIVRQKLGLVD